jgi:phage tail-like protein
MDVNGTRVHLLLGRKDFGSRCRTTPDGGGSTSPLEALFQASAIGNDAAFSWDAAQEELTLGSRVFYFTPAEGNVGVSLDDRRGAAFDMHGNVYWIATSGTEILVHSSGSRKTTHFWSSLDDPRDPRCRTAGAGTFAPLPSDTKPKAIALRGLAATALHFLIVGTLDPAGLLVFDLHRGGEPRQLLWPSTVPFVPFDLAATADGGLIVLDRQHRRLWGLDRAFGVVSLTGADAAAAPVYEFEPLAGGAGPKPPCRRTIALDMSLALGIFSAVAVESLPDGSVLVLESDPAASFSRVHRYAPAPSPPALAASGSPVSTEAAKLLIEEPKRAAFRLLGHDFVYARRDGQDLIYVAGTDGDQAFAFAIAVDSGSLSLIPVAEVYPMRLFGGRGLIAGPGCQPQYDSGDLWVPLAPLRAARFAQSGAFVIERLDGKDSDCVWHRLMIDAALPPGCDISVRSRASNDAAQLAFAEWQVEPRPRRRPTGTEIAWAQDLRRTGIETFELLFQRARGRYLQLEITLRGTGRCSPRLRAIRAWYPRFSYLERYLPAVYREHAESASFLDRFLANTEGFFTDIEGRVAGAQALLDYRTAPPDTLEWLASWFHVALDPAWDEPRRRLFIRHAAEFFEWRGTVPGLRMALRLATERCADDSTFAPQARRSEGIRIIERFRSRPLPGMAFTQMNEADGLPLRVTKATWDSTLGAADLHRRWREVTGDPAAMYPIAAPSAPGDRTTWSAFSTRQLGFVPQAGDATRWRATLQRRYPTLDHLNRAWKTAYGGWASVPLAAVLPENTAMLRDWIQFQSLVLPAHDAAHQFTVFLPQGTLGLRERDQTIDLVRRVVSLEKPAHTSFDVKFYWAFFRVGEARLGESTVVDLGSRSPELLSPFVLDRDYLGSGYLADAHPARPSTPCACGSSARGEQP